MDENKKMFYPPLIYYQNQIKASECSWCGYDGLDKLSIQHYGNDDGWKLNGHIQKQWLYVTCPRCDYDWALWKLGVPR